MLDDFINNLKEGAEALWKDLGKGLQAANVVRIGLGCVTQKIATETIDNEVVKHQYKKIRKDLQTSSESVYGAIQGEFADAVRSALKKQADIFGYQVEKLAPQM